MARLKLDFSMGGRRYLNRQRCDCCGKGLLEPQQAPDGSLALALRGARLPTTREQYCPECWQALRAAQRSGDLLLDLDLCLLADNRERLALLGFTTVSARAAVDWYAGYLDRQEART